MENGSRVSGVVTAAGAVYDCKAAVLCMGTYMKARCLTGEHIESTNNLMPATKLPQGSEKWALIYSCFKRARLPE